MIVGWVHPRLGLDVSVKSDTEFAYTSYSLRPRERLRSIVMSMSLCVFVCPRGYLRNRRCDLYHFLCVLYMSVARSSSGTFTIGRIAYRREGGDGSAQRGQNVIYTIA